MKSIQFLHFIKKKLKTIYPEKEAQDISLRLLEHVGFSSSKIFSDFLISNDTQKEIEPLLHRLLQNEPIQYVINKAFFYDVDLIVNKNVLIPRPETEELCEIVIKNHKNDSTLNVLDIGTGSGCIPIVLKKHLPFADISAIDISEKALEVAKENAKRHNVLIRFIKNNILELNNLDELGEFNILISNPPYVTKSEIKQMRKNVLNFEPHLALFVEDNNPFLFYNKIIELALKHKTIDKIYFELNEFHAHEIGDDLKKLSFKSISLLKDLFGKNRFLICEV